MLEETHAFSIPPDTVDGSCVAWGTEPSRRPPLDCECVLGFAPVLNVDHRLLCLHLCAIYLSEGEEGSVPHPYFFIVF